MEIEKKKLKATEELQHIAALYYNPFFKQEADTIRQAYQIPKEVEQACKWFFKEHSAKYDKVAYRSFATESSVLSKAIETIWESEVPLEKEILILLVRFGLPGKMFHNVLTYLLTGYKGCLCSFFWPSPDIKCEPDLRRGEPELTVTIRGLSPWTTQKQWNEIWTRLKHRVEEYKKDITEFFATYSSSIAESISVGEPSRKRATLESYTEQMKRWSEWYELSIVKGLGSEKTLDKWVKEHPDYYAKHPNLDVSTVTKAVNQFQRIITPHE